MPARQLQHEPALFFHQPFGVAFGSCSSALELMTGEPLGLSVEFRHE
jgi:hypothetical protein